ncbi:MAG: cytochrome-c oxidase, cbb3-type subunit III [Novosphingobium sp.]|nr:cytochrome-c oxidase, cbb3-type subunit III [Novosphingobium sp.]
MANRRIDEPTGTETVGHEWDGIEELNTPLPRWWLLTFYACIVFAIGYVVAYPAIPLLHGATPGLLGWSSRGDLAQELAHERHHREGVYAALARVPIERLPEDDARMRMAVAGGRAAFKVNCVQCHGAGAAGSEGFPNLNDDDWLWGGDLKTIEYTITHGVRVPGAAGTRMSQMPAFGRDGLLTDTQIGQLASHVLSLSGKEADDPAGAKLFADNCAVCHGPAGRGNRQLGAPNLTDAVWLYGRSRDEIVRQITEGRNGEMPAWAGRLDPVTIKMLAAYVHSLGGGEDFVEPAPASTTAPAAGAAANAAP